MKRTLEKSEILTKEFASLYPAGHTNARVKFNATEASIFAEKAEGSHIWDVDGNEYIEYISAYGPLMLGHRNEKWVEAIGEHLKSQSSVYGSGIIYGENDIKLAEKIISLVPCAEAVKLTTSGTEAVQTAIRIGRAYTGKNKILRFESMYHGWLDNIFINFVDDQIDEKVGPLYKEVPKDSPYYFDGISPTIRDESFVIPYNNFEILEETIIKYHDQIAICLLEPMASDVFCLHPVEGYLERLRELCTEYNIVLCFDEIISGFRLGLGGAQEYFGVTPDICTLGKAIGGGLPFSCVVGKKQFMDIYKEKNVVSGGTYNGYSLGIASSLATLNLYEEMATELYGTLEKVTEALITGMHAICEKYSVSFTTTECAKGGLIYMFFGLDYGRIKKLHDPYILYSADTEFYDRFWKNIQDEGILVMFGARWFVSGGHTLEDINTTLIAFENALVKTLKESETLETPIG
jgi:glutamate-1-semialdehyde 2,1-aminomutase